MVLDCKGLKCPQPVLKLAIRAKSIAPGTTVEVQADCAEFPPAIRKWCEDTNRVLISLVDHGTHSIATIQF